MMSLSFERTFPNCWGVVPWRIVEFTCSSISVVFASPLSSRNFLIFCLSLVVLISISPFFWCVSLVVPDPFLGSPFRQRWRVPCHSALVNGPDANQGRIRFHNGCNLRAVRRVVLGIQPGRNLCSVSWLFSQILADNQSQFIPPQYSTSSCIRPRRGPMRLGWRALI